MRTSKRNRSTLRSRPQSAHSMGRVPGQVLAGGRVCRCRLPAFACAIDRDRPRVALHRVHTSHTPHVATSQPPRGAGRPERRRAAGAGVERVRRESVKESVHRDSDWYHVRLHWPGGHRTGTAVRWQARPERGAAPGGAGGNRTTNEFTEYGLAYMTNLAPARARAVGARPRRRPNPKDESRVVRGGQSLAHTRVTRCDRDVRREITHEIVHRRSIVATVTCDASF